MKVIKSEKGQNGTLIHYSDIENTLESMQQVVGGLIEPIAIAQFEQNGVHYNVELVCNEEGKLQNLDYMAFIDYGDSFCWYDEIMGDFFIALANTDSGEFESIPEWLYKILDECFTHTNYNEFINDYQVLYIEVEYIQKEIQKYVK